MLAVPEELYDEGQRNTHQKRIRHKINFRKRERERKKGGGIVSVGGDLSFLLKLFLPSFFTLIFNYVLKILLRILMVIYV